MLFNKQASSSSTYSFGKAMMLLFDSGVQCMSGQTAEESFDLDFCSTFGQAKVEKKETYLSHAVTDNYH